MAGKKEVTKAEKEAFKRALEENPELARWIPIATIGPEPLTHSKIRSSLLGELNDMIPTKDRPAGVSGAEWRAVTYLAEYYLAQNPKDYDKLKPLMKWRHEQASGKVKHRRKFATARCAAYARARSMKLGDHEAWGRLKIALKDMGFSPPNDLKDWALRTIKKDDHSLNIYEAEKKAFELWSDEELRDSEPYILASLKDLDFL